MSTRLWVNFDSYNFNWVYVFNSIIECSGGIKSGVYFTVCHNSLQNLNASWDFHTDQYMM